MVEAFFSQAYLSIVARIKEEVPDIKWIDLDIGQLEQDTDRPAVQFPCLLVDFLDTTYDELGQLVETGKSTVQLRLGFAPFSATNSATPVNYQEKALFYFELENKVFIALHGWSLVYGENTISQPLVRKRAATEQRDDTYRVRVMQFTTDFEDDGAMPTRQRVHADMQIRSL